MVRIRKRFSVIRNGIDRKIPTGEIFFQRFSPLNNIRMPVIFISFFTSVGRYLVNILNVLGPRFTKFYTDRAELVIVKTIGKQLQNFFWSGIGCKIPPVRRPVHENIPHRPSDCIDLVAGFMKRVKNSSH